MIYSMQMDNITQFTDSVLIAILAIIIVTYGGGSTDQKERQN